jgi:hypothetical protein
VAERSGASPDAIADMTLPNSDAFWNRRSGSLAIARISTPLIVSGRSLFSSGRRGVGLARCIIII